MPIDPVGSIGLPPVETIQPAGGAAVEQGTKTGTQGFGDLLASSLHSLEGTLNEADAQSAALAAGTTQEVTEVVTSVERASLALQLAVQVRNKAVEAYQDLFRMQI